MKTLIELYDERPFENVLSTEMFHPERTVFLCPSKVAQNKGLQEKLRAYFAHRGLNTELVFQESSIYRTDKLRKQLKTLTETYEDCALDITGGTDAALFAGGQVSTEAELAVFTYSRKQNCFFDIVNAPFKESLPCNINYKVEDFFMMAGGDMRTGRVDNGVLQKYFPVIDPFFDVFLTHRKKWNNFVTYIQRVSQQPKNEAKNGEAGKVKVPVSLHVEADYTVKGNFGKKINADEAILRDLEKIGMIRGLKIQKGNSVTFDFADEQIRTWLRDVGSVLEVYVYKQCQDTGIFNDVHTSAVVDWDKDVHQDGVSNEIDVMAVKGVLPLFISCKVCDISTEALNELAILKDRFGGLGARAMIVSAEECRAITRHRASGLDIEVVDLEDLKKGNIKEHLISLMKN